MYGYYDLLYLHRIPILRVFSPKLFVGVQFYSTVRQNNWPEAKARDRVTSVLGLSRSRLSSLALVPRQHDVILSVRSHTIPWTFP